MKYVFCIVGMMCVFLGAAGFDSNMIIATILIVVGFPMMVPYINEFQREQEIEERRERREKRARK